MAGAVQVLGAVTLIGWLFDLQWLTAAWIGGTTVKPNTAAGMLLAATALRLHAGASASSRSQCAAVGCAWLSALIGGVTLIEYVFGLDLRVDDLLARVGSRASLRMAPNTALLLVLIGNGLALARARSLSLVAQTSLLVGLVIAFVALAGYAYRARELYGFPGFTSMALPTALCFALLSGGGLAAQPERGMSAILIQATPAGALLRRLLPVLASVPFALGWLALEGQRRGWYAPDFQLALLVALCTVSMCGVALRSAHTQGRAEWQMEQGRLDQQFSLQLSELLGAASEPLEMLLKAATVLGEYLHVSRALFSEIDPADDAVISHRDYHRALPSIAGERSLSSFPAEVRSELLRGGTAVVADTRTDPRAAAYYERIYEPLSVRACVLAPQLRNHQLVGLLLVSHHEPREFSAREIALIELVAERAWSWFEHLRSLQHLRVVLDESPIGKVTVDARSRITYVNRSFERLFGYARRELLGQAIELLVPFALRARHEQWRSGFIASPAARAMEAGRKIEGLRKDGSTIPVEIALTPLATAGRNVVLASVVDLTERSRVEAEREALLHELTSLNLELEERVRVRTDELSRALKEREVLLQEVHHRVKNNLQIVSSLINLQARKLGPGESRAALEACGERVATIAMTHEMLYQSKNYGEVPFYEYVQRLVTIVFRTHDSARTRIALRTEIERLSLPLDKAIPCGLIVNELIANALKHAFPGERTGRVMVELHRRGPTLELTVSDDGIGMPLDIDPERCDSLGMKLVTSLAQQLDATLQIVRNGGTCIRLQLPMEEPT